MDGGDGFIMLKSAKNKEIIGQLSDILAETIKKTGKISYQEDSRLSITTE